MNRLFRVEIFSFSGQHPNSLLINVMNELISNGAKTFTENIWKSSDILRSSGNMNPLVYTHGFLHHNSIFGFCYI